MSEGKTAIREKLSYAYPADTLEFVEAVGGHVRENINSIMGKVDLDALWENVVLMYDTWEEMEQRKWNLQKNKEEQEDHRKVTVSSATNGNANAKDCATVVNNGHSEINGVDVNLQALLAVLRATNWFSNEQYEKLDGMLVTVSSIWSPSAYFPQGDLISVIQQTLGAESAEVKYKIDGFEAGFANAQYRKHFDYGGSTTAKDIEVDSPKNGVNGTLYLAHDGLYIIEVDGQREDYVGGCMPCDLYSLELALNSEEWRAFSESPTSSSGYYRTSNLKTSNICC